MIFLQKNCDEFIQYVRSSTHLVGKFQKKITTDGELYFYLKAESGQPIASQKHTSALSRDHALERIQKLAPAACVEHRT
jgi:uncharacterized protein YegP (UPF0339 family)